MPCKHQEAARGRRTPGAPSRLDLEALPRLDGPDVDGCLTPSKVFLAEAVVCPGAAPAATCAAANGARPTTGRSARPCSASPPITSSACARHGSPAGTDGRCDPSPARERPRLPQHADRRHKASATAKSGRKPQDWLPRKVFRCSYLGQWVAVKWRWRLTVDPIERRFLKSRLSSCGWPSVRSEPRLGERALRRGPCDPRCLDSFRKRALGGW